MPARAVFSAGKGGKINQAAWSGGGFLPDTECGFQAAQRVSRQCTRSAPHGSAPNEQTGARPEGCRRRAHTAARPQAMRTSPYRRHPATSDHRCLQQQRAINNSFGNFCQILPARERPRTAVPGGRLGAILCLNRKVRIGLGLNRRGRTGLFGTTTEYSSTGTAPGGGRGLSPGAGSVQRWTPAVSDSGVITAPGARSVWEAEKRPGGPTAPAFFSGLQRSHPDHC